MSDALDNARAALAWINRMHPESTIQVGSETHGGPPQYGQGCIHHGAYCPWLGERKVLEALIAENERLTAPPTDDERKVARAAAYRAWIETDVSPDGPNLHAIVDAALEAAKGVIA